MSDIPANLQAILWSKDVNNLDLDTDKTYIIHQILAYGTTEHIKWLFSKYNEFEIKKTFSDTPEKNYSEKSFNFIKNILLAINSNIDKSKYVTTLPRYIG